MARLALVNYPIETELQRKFWGSNHKCNRAKAIIAFSLNKANAMRNLKTVGGMTHFWRHRAWNAFGQYVNTPSMEGIPYSEMKDLYWHCMPNNVSSSGNDTDYHAPPRITVSNAPTSLILGTIYPYTITVTGLPTPVIQWEVDGVVQDETSDSFLYTPDSAGAHTITVTATNSSGTASETFNVSVTDLTLQSFEISATINPDIRKINTGFKEWVI